MSFLQARYLDNHSLRILDERPRCIHFLLKTKPRLSTTSFDAFCSRTRERSQKRSGPDEPVTLENSRTRRKQCYDRSSTIKPVANRQERNEIKDFLSPAFVDRLQKRPSLYANFFPRLLLPLPQKSRQTSSTNTSSLSKCSEPMQLCTRFPNKTATTRLTKRTGTNKHKKPKKKTKNKRTRHKNQAKNKTSIYSHTSTKTIINNLFARKRETTRKIINNG